jgi:hypothetical protein
MLSIFRIESVGRAYAGATENHYSANHYGFVITLRSLPRSSLLFYSSFSAVIESGDFGSGKSTVIDANVIEIGI